MKSQNKKTYNPTLGNAKVAAQIKYMLRAKGYKLSDIATELNISQTAVSRSIYGVSKISRVDNFLKKVGVNFSHVD